MAGTEPGERAGTSTTRPARELERPPGERYTRPRGRPEATGHGSGLALPVIKASVAAALGAVLLFALGALFAQTAGLLFVAGLTGAVVGLLVARTRVPGDNDRPELTRRQAAWLAIGITLAAVVVGAVGTWLNALREGGTLGLLDYLLETFGPFVPAEIIVAEIAAAWGVGAGPVER